jgi:ABC-type nickel/cobalt efflux system permease component RcnA
MQALTEGSANSAEINCGGPVVSGRTAADAASQMADAEAGDLTALPSPAAGGQAASSGPASPPTAGLLARWTAWIGAIQTRFNRELTAALKSFRESGAFLWLGGISFLYGIAHAAGPGHGKVVISSYLVANEARIRRGVAIAFIAAFVQALVAVGIIGLLAVVLNMTSMAIDSTARVFEAGSFALVAALGAYLLARKSRALWAMMRGGDPHAHHDHHHHHDHHEHGHDHAEQGERHMSPLPDASPQGRGFAPAAAAILSVGIRPCTGALVVLVFALSQGIFWAGVASTFVMALGTALTVAVLAALAVGAKDFARKLARGDDRRSGQLMLVLELIAALVITALGVVLFVGTVYA